MCPDNRSNSDPACLYEKHTNMDVIPFPSKTASSCWQAYNCIKIPWLRCWFETDWGCRSWVRKTMTSLSGIASSSVLSSVEQIHQLINWFHSFLSLALVQLNRTLLGYAKLWGLACFSSSFAIRCPRRWDFRPDSWGFCWWRQFLWRLSVVLQCLNDSISQQQGLQWLHALPKETVRKIISGFGWPTLENHGELHASAWVREASSSKRLEEKRHCTLKIFGLI